MGVKWGPRLTWYFISRPGSIQTRPQIDVVHSFATFLSPLWVFFPTSCCVGNPQQGPSVEDLVHNQTLVLHGQQAANLKDVPKARTITCICICARDMCCMYMWMHVHVHVDACDMYMWMHVHVYVDACDTYMWMHVTCT